MKIVLENIEPLPQPRPKFGKGGKVYQAEKITAYKNMIGYAAKNAMEGKPPTLDALKINLRFYRRFKVTSRSFGDCDNLAKAILDACNGVIWADDAQITRLTVEKHKAETAKIEMEITEVS